MERRRPRRRNSRVKLHHKIPGCDPKVLGDLDGSETQPLPWMSLPQHSDYFPDYFPDNP